MNIPNLLTLSRMVASFAVFYFGLQSRWDLAFPIFCVAALTDMIDGTIARLLRQRTRLGAFLDPTADKLLMFFSFITLTKDRYLPLSLTLLVVARDLLIIVGLIILRAKKVTIIYRPTYLSKLTTFLQILSIFAAMFETQGSARLSMIPPAFLQGKTAILITTATLTLTTGIQYFWMGLRMIQGEKAQTHRQ